MAKLTPDATRTEHGLVINEKIIPWGAVWPKDSGAYKKGAQYKADRLLSGGTGKVKGVTIHNTNDLKNVEEDAEQYTRATWPNANMNDARVHYYVDDINAWQNLREDEVGWHAGDGRKATGGNETTLSIEIIMDGSGSKEDRVYSGRAYYRPAYCRCAPPDRGAAEAGRCGQHGYCHRAQSGSYQVRRPYH